MDRLTFLVESYRGFQKERIRLGNRLSHIPEDQIDENLRRLKAEAEKIENDFAAHITKEVELDPLYTSYLQYQKGVGPIMGSKLIAWMARIRRFPIQGVQKKLGEGRYERKRKDEVEVIELPPYAKVLSEDLKEGVVEVEMPPVMTVAENPSDLHRYSGISPGSLLRRGTRATFNPKAKTLMWQVFRQLRMARGHWAFIARAEKAAYAKRCPLQTHGTKKLAVDRTTKNIVMRRFMTNLWLVYRHMNNLPITEPYPGIIGHAIEPPFIETPEGVEYLDYLKPR